MTLFTIGFTKKSAETFFTRLQQAGVSRLVDTRLNNTSQLAGFAKRDDLDYFTRTICGIDYIHRNDLAPTGDLLDAYKKKKGLWSVYEAGFLELMQERHIEDMPRDLLANACLLCSEERPHHCDRRLVAEYLQQRWSDLDILHL